MVSFQGCPFFSSIDSWYKALLIDYWQWYSTKWMWGGWRGDLTIIPKLLLYCGQIKVVFVRGLDMCMSHLEEYTQMYYSFSIRGWKLVGTDRQVEVQRANQALSSPMTQCYSWVSALCRRFQETAYFLFLWNNRWDDEFHFDFYALICSCSQQLVSLA